MPDSAWADRRRTRQGAGSGAGEGVRGTLGLRGARDVHRSGSAGGGRGAGCSEADVLALPNPSSAISREFTSPLKLFEYMASGRPIVASDLPSLREVLADGRNALLVEPATPRR